MTDIECFLGDDLTTAFNINAPGVYKIALTYQQRMTFESLFAKRNINLESDLYFGPNIDYTRLRLFVIIPTICLKRY